MTEQLESLIPDSEIQNVCEEISGTLAGAFDLLVARRDRKYADAIAPLDQERDALLKEHSAIGQAAKGLEAVLAAQERELRRESDRLIVAGDTEAAQVKIVEMEKAKNAPMAMRQRQEAISLRLVKIEREKQRIARDLFAEWYEKDVQPVVRAAEKGLADLLDGLKASFSEFETRTRTGVTAEGNFLDGLVKLWHHENLTGDVRGVWGRLHVWYGGRQ